MYLETQPTFFTYAKWELLFQPFEVGWLSPKMVAILTRSKQRNDVTDCITLMPLWKFRVIMGEETKVQSPPKNISELRHKEV